MMINCICACFTSMYFRSAFGFSNFVHAYVHGVLSLGGLSNGGPVLLADRMLGDVTWRALIESILERKVMLVVYLQKSWRSRTQSPFVVEESLSQALGCTLISFTDC